MPHLVSCNAAVEAPGRVPVNGKALRRLHVLLPGYSSVGEGFCDQRLVGGGRVASQGVLGNIDR